VSLVCHSSRSTPFWLSLHVNHSFRIVCPHTHTPWNSNNTHPILARSLSYPCAIARLARSSQCRPKTESVGTRDTDGVCPRPALLVEFHRLLVERPVCTSCLATIAQLMGWNRYRTLADRLLSIRLVSTRRLIKRDVSYEFMNRQMVWHAFTVCICLLPARSI
jgi:Pex2 / Pex12 amino terminal region